MLGIVRIRAPKVEAAGEAQRVRVEEDLLVLPGDDGNDLSPVMLHLTAGRGLEPDRGPGGPQGPPGLYVIPDDRGASGIPFCLEFLEYHRTVPDPFRQEIVDKRLEGIELAVACAGTLSRGSATTGNCPRHCFGVNSQFLRNVLLIDAFFHQFLDLHPVLLFEHIDIPSGIRTFLPAEHTGLSH